MVSRLESSLGVLVIAMSMYYISEELQLLRKDLENVKTLLAIQSDQTGQLHEKLDTLSVKMSSYIQARSREQGTGHAESTNTNSNPVQEDLTTYEKITKITQRPNERKSQASSGLPPDAVLHPLTSSLTNKSLIVHCVDLKYDNNTVNVNWASINENGELVNRKLNDSILEVRKRLQNYRGALTTQPLPLNGHPQYWEIMTKVTLTKPLKDTDLIFETGICVERDCDHYGPAKERHTYSMTVQHIEDKGIRIMGWANGSIAPAKKDLMGFPVHLHNRAGTSGDLHYGIVFDNVRNKIAFNDVNDKDTRIVIDHVDSEWPIWPMFGLFNPDMLTVSIKLVVGREIAMTEQKKEMILKSLLYT